MAAWDTWTERRGMLGWGSGGMLPVASGSFDGTDAQLFLALPGQDTIANGELPEPEPAPSGGQGKSPRRKTGIGPR